MTVINTGAQQIVQFKERLRKCCLDSLRHFYLDEAGILAKGVSWDGAVYKPATPSVLDTANVLIALFKLQSLGLETSLDADRLLARCVSDYLSKCEFSEVALLLWADSLADQIYQKQLWSELQRRIPRDISNTMLLSWTLCGVCEAVKAGVERNEGAALAMSLYERISRNQVSSTGLFFSSASREGVFRRRKATAHLPSQVFAVQALAQYSASFGDGQASERAVKCAARLCSLQGPHGQWWCVYDVRKATVVEEYPVYSVHQDGSMPTALSLVARIDPGAGFEEASNRGLFWVFGNNELETCLVDDQGGLVMRGIRQDGDSVGIIREMRAYHAGRCLYALAISAEFA